MLVPHAFKVRGGCDGGGKGYLGSDDTAFTVATHQDQQIAQPVAFRWQNEDARIVEDSCAASLRAKGTTTDERSVGAYAIAQPVAPALTASNDPSRSPQSSEVTQQVTAVHQAAMQVRRLTPVECERLQGFRDNHTNIPWRGKAEAPDGPRYKALGNSMAVPVMRWIGERINA